MNFSAENIASAVDSQRATIESIFSALENGSRDGEGISRVSYGEGENFAHRLLADFSRSIGLEVSTDASANTYMTLPGRRRDLPRIVIGSHLDSVKNGGNYDGAAGVVAGLGAILALAKLGITPECDVVAMGIRAEESVWFQVSYLGSRGALGLLPEGALDAKRIDTGISARDHIAKCGGDPDMLASGHAHLSRQNVKAFIEPHIEQAPRLVEQGIPVGICLGVPGLFMYADARVSGEYGHVGTPRMYRHDAAMAAADFAMQLDQEWERQLAAGRQMAITFGRFHTDSEAHGLTTIAGEFRFSVDIRGYEQDLIDHMERQVDQIIERVQRQRRVSFDLGNKRSAAIGYVDKTIRESLEKSAIGMNVPYVKMYSPASHDAGAFCAAGIPTGMIMIRNQNGSHNPDERMETDDFLQGLRVLVSWLIQEIKGVEPD